MSEVYSTPVHDSPESQEVSVDTLGKDGHNYSAAIRRALSGLAKGQKRGVDPTALVEYKIYLPAKVACQALDRAFDTMTSLNSEPVRLLADLARCEQFRGDLFLAFNFADFGRGDSHASMEETDVDVT